MTAGSMTTARPAPAGARERKPGFGGWGQPPASPMNLPEEELKASEPERPDSQSRPLGPISVRNSTDLGYSQRKSLAASAPQAIPKPSRITADPQCAPHPSPAHRP